MESSRPVWWCLRWGVCRWLGHPMLVGSLEKSHAPRLPWWRQWVLNDTEFVVLWSWTSQPPTLWEIDFYICVLSSLEYVRQPLQRLEQCPWTQFICPPRSLGLSVPGLDSCLAYCTHFGGKCSILVSKLEQIEPDKSCSMEVIFLQGCLRELGITTCAMQESGLLAVTLNERARKQGSRWMPFLSLEGTIQGRVAPYSCTWSCWLCYLAKLWPT